MHITTVTLGEPRRQGRSQEVWGTTWERGRVPSGVSRPDPLLVGTGEEEALIVPREAEPQPGPSPSVCLLIASSLLLLPSVPRIDI